MVLHRNVCVSVCVCTALQLSLETPSRWALANVRARKLVLRGWREACQGTNRHIDRASRLLCMLVCTYQHMYMYAQSGREREESSVATLRLFPCMTDALARELLRLRAAEVVYGELNSKSANSHLMLQ